MRAPLDFSPPVISGPTETLLPVDPLKYAGWDSLLAHHPASSFFHGTAWARVLQETYGHRLFYFCRFAEGQLTGLLPVMEVSSVATARRGVSLPFTDFCLPLNGRTNPPELYEAALTFGRKRGWRYLECRSNDPGWAGSKPSLAFYNHVIDLTPSPGLLFKAFDDSVQRGVRKAGKSGLKIQFDTTVKSIQTFFSLHSRTRQRHGVPPQPFRFFANIARLVLEKGQGFVATARLGDRPVASSVFFHDRREAIFKFGASDFAFQHLRPNHLLMWESIKRCATLGFHHLHLGRTSLANDGLRRFKNGFGACEKTIEYFKYDFSRSAFVTDVDRSESGLNRLFSRLPLPLLRLSGRILYPHLS